MFNPHHYFNRNTIIALRNKGISVIGLQAIPDMTSSMPYANAETGYLVNDMGTGRLLTHREVLEMSTRQETPR